MRGKSFVKLSCVVVAAVSLSGCQSTGLTSWLFKKGSSPTREEQPSLAQAAAESLAEGASHLRQGNFAAAAASYRIALLDSATAADAANGLAVTYAKVGRLDLAERYFTAALNAQPDNPKFAANLLRLQAEISLAKNAAERTEVLVADSSATQAVNPAAVAAEQRSVVQRVSRAEVMIRTRSDLGNAPSAPRVATVSPVRLVERSSERSAASEVRSANLAKVISQRPDYPIRIALGE